MPEHRIRLRGGWRCHGSSEDPQSARPLTLPTHWPSSATGPLRLTRRFGLPAVDPGRETVTLVAEHVPGLLCARLNDEPVRGIDDAARLDSFEVGNLRTKNEVVLEVDPVRAAAHTVGPEGWGQIALVVRS